MHYVKKNSRHWKMYTAQYTVH